MYSVRTEGHDSVVSLSKAAYEKCAKASKLMPAVSVGDLIAIV
jgi:hypothetical protein